MNKNVFELQDVFKQSNHHKHSTSLQAGCPSCRPTNSVRALKGKVKTSSKTDKCTKWEKKRRCVCNWV